jgi:poly(A) polymerase
VKLTLLPPIFKDIKDLIAKENCEAYIVGGYVRDMLLNRPSKDIDIVVVGDGIELAKKFATQAHEVSDFAYFKTFGTAMVKTMGWEVEFVGARKESYSPDSRKPSITIGSIEDDQNRRDFTINALAVSLMPHSYGELIDPFGGLTDLENKRIRTPLDPDITFSDDPLRMMRGIRFSAQLNFEILPETFEAIKRNANRIKIISTERINDELNKILLSPKPSIGFNLLFDTGLLEIIFPELAAMHGVSVQEGKAHKDNFYHTLMVLDNLSRESGDLWTRWAALLHDIGKPSTKRFVAKEGGWTFHGHEDKGARMVPKIFGKLKLPLNEKMKRVQKLVALHHRPKVLAEEGVTDAAIRRLVVDAGDELDDLFTICRADITTQNKFKLERYLKNLEQVRQLVEDVSERDRLRNWQPPIDGEHIMKAFGIGPSKEIGLIKAEIREAILDGKIPNNYEAAYQLMIDCGMRLGLNKV